VWSAEVSKIRYSLAADVGGTKTLFELGVTEGDRYRALHTGNFLNADYTGVAEVSAAFLATVPERPSAIHSACFALAGPVIGRRVRLTNLPWEEEDTVLAQRLEIGRVRFINDFAAVGHGIPSLAPDELLCVQAGRPEPNGVRGVLGAGTGLGMVLMVWAGNGYRVVPSEGGKADFAPVNEVQNRLWIYLSHRFDRAGNETLLSGRGLERIYAFLGEADTLRIRSGGRTQETLVSAPEITTRAMDGTDPRASSTVNLFLEIYGAVAGNLALTLMAHGGIYIAGGIAPRIASMFNEGAFLRGFHAKGRVADLMQTFPLHVVLTPEVGLRGAVAIAAQGAGNAG
jgi:glucokinase